MRKPISVSSLQLSSDYALFLQSADSLGAKLHLHLFAVDHHCFSLKIRLPDLLSVTLREADIAAVLLALTG